MANRLIFTLGVQGADDAIAKVVALDKRLKDLADTMRKARNAGDDELYDRAAKSAVKYKQALSEARKELRASVAENKAAVYSTTSLIALENQYAKLREEIRLFSKEERESAAGRGKINLAANLSTQIRDIDKQMGSFKSSIGNYKDGLAKVADTLSGGLFGELALGGSAAVAAGGLAITAGAAQLFQLNAKFSDLKADISKTTGLTAAETNEVIENLAALDTRTSLEKLAQIAEIGGQLGIKGVDGVTAFTKSLEVLDVALGKEFKGGTEEVATEIGKLSNVLFGVTDNGEEMASRMLGIGNALNFLAASGNATSPVITDFAQRMGGVLAPLDVTAGQVLGLSAAMEELAISPERGATAAARSIMRMGANIEQFSRVLGVSQDELSKAFNTNPLNAFLDVIELVNKKAGGDKTSMLAILNDLDIRGAGVSEVFFKFGQNMELVEKRVGDATEKLEDQSSVMSEYAIKQNNLAGAWERFKNKITEAFVDSKIEAFFSFLLRVVSELVTQLEIVGGLISAAFKPINVKDPLGNFRDAINNARASELKQKRDELSSAGQAIVSATNSRLDKVFGSDGKSGGGLLGSGFKTQEQKNAEAESALTKLTSSKLEGKYVSEEERKRQYIAEKAAAQRIQAQKQADKERLEALKNVEEVESRIAKLRSGLNKDEFKRREDELRVNAESATKKAKIGGLGITPEMIKEETDLIAAQLANDLESLRILRVRAQEDMYNDLLDLQRQNNIDMQALAAKAHETHVEDLQRERDEALTQADIEYEEEQIRLDQKLANSEITQRKYEDLSLDARQAHLDKVKGINKQKNEELLDEANKFFVAQSALLKKQNDEEILAIQTKVKQQKRAVEDAVRKGEKTPLVGAIEIAALESSEANKIQEKKNELVEKEKALLLDIKGIKEGINEDERANNAEKTKIDAERKEQQKRDLIEVRDATFEVSQILSDELFALEEQRAEDEKRLQIEALKATFDAELEAVQGNATLQKALKKEFEAEKREIEKRAFEETKKREIQQALANAALAIIQVFASTPFPFSLIAAGIVGLKTGFEIAKIKAKKFAKGGFTGKVVGIAPDETGQVPVGVVHENEYVAPTHQIKKYPSLFKFLDNDRMRKFADGGLTSAFSGGGESTLKVELSKEQIDILSESVYAAAKSGTTSGAKEGVYLGASDAQRLRERQEALVANNSF